MKDKEIHKWENDGGAGCSHPITFAGKDGHVFCSMCLMDITTGQSIEELEKVPTPADDSNFDNNLPAESNTDLRNVKVHDYEIWRNEKGESNVVQLELDLDEELLGYYGC